MSSESECVFCIFILLFLAGITKYSSIGVERGVRKNCIIIDFFFLEKFVKFVVEIFLRQRNNESNKNHFR